jgi:hypothetical protein
VDEPNFQTAVLNRDLDMMNFETKVRSLMRELIEPVIEKGQKDREMIMRLEMGQQKFADRVDLIEEACYNQKSKREGQVQKSKFDYIEDKIVQLEIKQGQMHEETQDTLKSFLRQLNEYKFLIDTKLI